LFFHTIQSKEKYKEKYKRKKLFYLCLFLFIVFYCLRKILEAWVVDGTRIENKQGSKNTIPPQYPRKFLNMSVEDRAK